MVLPTVDIGYYRTLSLSSDFSDIFQSYEITNSSTIYMDVNIEQYYIQEHNIDINIQVEAGYGVFCPIDLEILSSDSLGISIDIDLNILISDNSVLVPIDDINITANSYGLSATDTIDLSLNAQTVGIEPMTLDMVIENTEELNIPIDIMYGFCQGLKEKVDAMGLQITTEYIDFSLLGSMETNDQVIGSGSNVFTIDNITGVLEDYIFNDSDGSVSLKDYNFSLIANTFNLSQCHLTIKNYHWKLTSTLLPSNNSYAEFEFDSYDIDLSANMVTFDDSPYATLDFNISGDLNSGRLLKQNKELGFNFNIKSTMLTGSVITASITIPLKISSLLSSISSIRGSMDIDFDINALLESVANSVDIVIDLDLYSYSTSDTLSDVYSYNLIIPLEVKGVCI